MSRVVGLARFPVKSMLGEPVDRLAVDARGVAGDRLWSVRTAEGKIGSGKNTRRFAHVPGLLDLRAGERDGRIVITFPDGGTCAVDDPDAADRVSRHLGRPVTLAHETAVSHFDDGPVSLVGRASVAALAEHRGVEIDPVRFRANILLDTDAPFAEHAWVGHDIAVGSAVLRVSMTSPRCVMIDAATADLPAQQGNLLAIGRLNGAHLGVIASVVVPGTITAGDDVVVTGISPTDPAATAPATQSP